MRDLLISIFELAWAHPFWTVALLIFATLSGHTSWLVLSFAWQWHSARIAKVPAARLATYLGALVREWWSTALTAFTYPLGLLPALRTGPWQAQGGPPIVLVHGYLMNRACMLGLYWRLRHRGLSNLYFIDLRPTWGAIETVGARATVKLRLISKSCGGVPLVAICHSMGGLVMRWCAQNDPTLPLAKIICLASPHQGTLVAALAVGANGAQLRQGSPLLASLRDAGGVPVVSIYSDLDNIVLPAASAAFGERSVRFEHCGHASLLYDAKVFEAVWQELVRLRDAK